MTWDSAREHAEGLVDMFLDERLESANEPPGLRTAIVQGVQMRSEEVPSEVRPPGPPFDLFDAALTDSSGRPTAAAGQHATHLQALELCGSQLHPRRFERVLAGRLAPSARWAMRAEASRVPRPPTRPKALEWSLAPIPWVEDESEWPPPGAVSLVGTRQLIGNEAEPSRVAEEPYTGWVQLGMFEQQRTLRSSYPEVPGRQLLITTGLEVFDESPPSASLPLSGARPIAWTIAHDRIDPDLDQDLAAQVLATTQGPLAAIMDYDLEPSAPHRLRGAGLYPFALAPRFEVVSYLGLRPEQPSVRHVLVDDEGPALVGRVWRGFLIHDGNYTPLVPGVQGADLILRQDLYERLESVLGRDRLSFGISVTHHEDDDPDDQAGDGT